MNFYLFVFVLFLEAIFFLALTLFLWLLEDPAP